MRDSGARRCHRAAAAADPAAAPERQRSRSGDGPGGATPPAGSRGRLPPPRRIPSRRSRLGRRHRRGGSRFPTTRRTTCSRRRSISPPGMTVSRRARSRSVAQVPSTQPTDTSPRPRRRAPRRRQPADHPRRARARPPTGAARGADSDRSGHAGRNRRSHTEPDERRGGSAAGGRGAALAAPGRVSKPAALAPVASSTSPAELSRCFRCVIGNRRSSTTVQEVRRYGMTQVRARS